MLSCRKCTRPIDGTAAATGPTAHAPADEFLSVHKGADDDDPGSSSDVYLQEHAFQMAPLHVHDSAMRAWSSETDNLLDGGMWVCSRCALHLTSIIDFELDEAAERKKLAVEFDPSRLPDARPSRACRNVGAPMHFHGDVVKKVEESIQVGRLRVEARYLEKEIDQLESFTPVKLWFRLESDGKTVKLNSKRLWPLHTNARELNAALGDLALLAWTVERKLGGPGERFKIVPMGPASRLDIFKDDGGRLSLVDLYISQKHPSISDETVSALLGYLGAVVGAEQQDIASAIGALYKRLLE